MSARSKKVIPMSERLSARPDRYTKRPTDPVTVAEAMQLVDQRLMQVLKPVMEGFVADYEAHRRRNAWWRKLWRRFVPDAPKDELPPASSEKPTS